MRHLVPRHSPCYNLVTFPRLAIALVVTVYLGLSVPLAAQRIPAARVPGAILLKRIAEAVDGDRSGSLVYVVASYEPTFPVIGVFNSPKAAQDLVAKTGPNAAVFGPYQTVPDLTPPSIVGCVHRRSVMKADYCVPPSRPLHPKDIVGMTLVITRTQGKPESLVLPADTDAIFLTLSTIDKFVVPYYLRTFSLATVSELRGDFRSVFSKR